jgi:heme exporter protein B
MVSGIAAKASNSSTLMAVLSFPIMMPLLLVVMKISKNAIDGLDPSVSYDDIVVLMAINGIIASLSYILFPYLWRS